LKNIENKFLEDDIFGNKEQTIQNFASDTLQDEIDDVGNICDNEQKIGISLTDIVCDSKGLQLLTKDVSEDIPDFSEYKFNNFKITENNDCINELEEKGGAIVLNTDGEIMLRVSQDADFKVVTEDKASKVITNLLGKLTIVGRGTKDRPPDIPISDLMLISGVEFEQHIMAEFHKDGNTHKHNKFQVNELMMLDKNTPYKKPVLILTLIAHLVNYHGYRFHYIINWLAYMFVFLIKSQVAIVLRGAQGSGKGILFTNIIASLFGKDYSFTVGNKTLKSQFLGSVFENRLFININEMSHDLKSNKELKNSLKELVTDEEFAGEKKYENISKPIKLTAQILITSNEAYILEIEPGDRRFTVLSTAGNIANEDCNFFGYGNFKLFKKQIESEMRDFALYLKNYPIDTNLVNKALDTREKRALIKGTNDRFKLFINILVNEDISSLEQFKVTNPEVYANVMSGFKKGRIYQRDLLPAYTALNPSDLSISTHGLLDKLEIYEPTKFSRELRKKSGDWYFNL
jgi:hypothetical protein